MESECESEMNRQMLRRNKELEDCIKFQRETIQDQAMRIEVKLRRILGMDGFHYIHLCKNLNWNKKFLLVWVRNSSLSTALVDNEMR